MTEREKIKIHWKIHWKLINLATVSFNYLFIKCVRGISSTTSIRRVACCLHFRQHKKKQLYNNIQLKPVERKKNILHKKLQSLFINNNICYYYKAMRKSLLINDTVLRMCRETGKSVRTCQISCYLVINVLTWKQIYRLFADSNREAVRGKRRGWESAIV